MKNFIYFCTLFLCILSFSNSASAQKVTLDFRQTELKSVLDEIQKQTGHVFYYSEPPVDAQMPVTIKASDEILWVVLDKIFSNTQITYLVSDLKIYLKQDDPAPKTSGSVYKGLILDSDNQPIIGAHVRVVDTD